MTGNAKEPVPPGPLLLDWLVEHGKSQSWLAGELGCSLKHVNAFIRNRTGFSPAMSEALARITASGAPNYWWQLQCDWQFAQKHNEKPPARKKPARKKPAKKQPAKKQQATTNT